MKKKCTFCTSAPIKARTVYRDKLVWIFPTNIPITPGHMLVCPTRCVEKIDDLSIAELKAIQKAVVKIKKVLKKTFGAQGFNCAWNEGGLAGQSIPHLHIHIVPRKTGDEGIYTYGPRKFLYRPGSRSDSPEQELQEIATLIKKHL